MLTKSGLPESEQAESIKAQDAAAKAVDKGLLIPTTRPQSGRFVKRRGSGDWLRIHFVRDYPGMGATGGPCLYCMSLASLDGMLFMIDFSHHENRYGCRFGKQTGARLCHPHHGAGAPRPAPAQPYGSP